MVPEVLTRGTHGKQARKSLLYICVLVRKMRKATYLLAARIQRVSTVVTCDRAPTHLSKNTFDTTYIDCIDHSVLLPAVRLAPAGIALLQVLIQIQCRREGLCPCCHMAFKVANVSVAICISRGNSRIAKGLSSKGHRLRF